MKTEFDNKPTQPAKVIWGKEEQIRTENRKKVRNSVITGTAVLIALTLDFGIRNGYNIISTISSNSSTRERVKGVDTDLFVKNKIGTPKLLSITGGQVHLNIQDEFNDEQKEELKEGIEQIDDLAEGFTYSFKGTDRRNRCIDIILSTELDPLTYATTTFSSSNNFWERYSTAILYPITIKINKQALENDSNFDMNKVIKKELLHTLGFKDLTYKKYKDYFMFKNSNKFDLSEEEVRALSTVYGARDSEAVKTVLPEQIQYIKFNQDEENLEQIN